MKIHNWSNTGTTLFILRHYEPVQGFSDTWLYDPPSVDVNLRSDGLKAVGDKPLYMMAVFKTKLLFCFIFHILYRDIRGKSYCFLSTLS